MNRVLVNQEYIEDTNFDMVCTPESLAQGAVQPASVTELLCNDVLDYVPNREQLLQLLASKLRYNGKIILTGVDLDEVARELTAGRIDNITAINILYRGRMSSTSLTVMMDLLRQLGLRVLSARVENFHYFLTGVRDAATAN